MYACVFPGQGSQYLGMGKDLYENNVKIKNFFHLIDDILGYKLSQIMFEGTEEELKSTEISQLAIFVHSIAMTKAINYFEPNAVAGHSLGEYSALVAAEGLDLEDGLNLVKERALAMKKATEINPGKMAAVLGLEDEMIEEVCKNIDDVWPANYNSPGQAVISGSIEGIELASKKLMEVGAKKIIELKVSGAFHTKFMESAKIELNQILKDIKIKKPKFLIYQNFTAKPTQDPNLIKINLIEQIVSPVLWTQTIQNMVKNGINSFEEIGPGNVLKGLIMRIDRKVNIKTPELIN